MFAIFSLRRPNILPVGKQSLVPLKPIHSDFLTRPFTGDLGVQRGLCRWYLSLHSDEHPIVVSPQKKKTPAKPKSARKGKKAVANEDLEDADDVNDNIAGPSITKILKTMPLSRPPRSLPDGLSIAILKSRLSGKKVK